MPVHEGQMPYDSTVVKTVAVKRHLVVFKYSNKSFRFQIAYTGRWARNVNRSSSRIRDAGLIRVESLRCVYGTLVAKGLSVMLGAWIPTKQLVRFMVYGTSGLPVGAFFTVLLGGITCSSPSYRWPFIFYASGAIGVLWCIVWLYLCFDSRFIPILTSSANIHRTDFPKRSYSVPLKEILTSKPFWGYVSAGIAAYWMIALNILVLPTYFWVVFRISIEWNGMLSSFPNVMQAFLYIMGFATADHMIAKRKVDKTTVRRFVACSGLSVFATCMVLLTFVKCYRALGVLLIMIGVGASGFTLASLSVIPLDMSPNFSGILSGIMNTCGTLVGSALPLMVGYFTDGERDLRNWDKVFYASVFITFVCMILFMAYSSCAIQPWNNPEEAEVTLIDLPAEGSQAWTETPVATETSPASTSKHQEGNDVQRPSSTSSKTTEKKRSKGAPIVIDY